MTTSSDTHYFNTALLSLLIASFFFNKPIQAKVIDRATLCHETPSTDLSTSNRTNPRFIPQGNAYNDLRDELKQSTLPILSANDTKLWHLGSRILTQVPTDWDFSKDQNKTFLIVRKKTIKTSSYQPTLGQFVQIIGIAHAKPNATPPTAALTITHTDREVTTQDYLIPAHCIPKFMLTNKNSEPDKIPTPKSQTILTAQIVGFLDEHAIAGLNAVVLMNKGILDGVFLGQKWWLVDQLPQQPASAQAFGHAQVIETFPNVSVLRVNDVQHELRLNTSLYSQQP